MSIRPFTRMLVSILLGSFLLGHVLSAEWTDPPPGQPEQMWSLVEYDPRLTDPFFTSNEWSYWEGSRRVPDSGMWLGDNPPRPLKHAARCFSTSFGTEHEVRFCEAKSLDPNTIDLFIREHNPAFDYKLRIDVRNGRFTCQYWTYYRGGPEMA